MKPKYSPPKRRVSLKTRIGRYLPILPLIFNFWQCTTLRPPSTSIKHKFIPPRQSKAIKTHPSLKIRKQKIFNIIKRSRAIDFTPSREDKKFAKFLSTKLDRSDIENAVLFIVFTALINPRQSPDSIIEQINSIYQENQLEILQEKIAMDFTSTLSENVYLFNLPVFYRFLQFLHASSDTPAFKRKLLEQIKDHLQTIEKISNLIHTLNASSLSLQDKNFADSKEEDAPPRLASYGLLKEYEYLLGDADKLAIDGKYKQAIKLATQIQEGEVLFESSRKAVRHFSTQAVKILRQQASQLFKKSLSILDKKTKYFYLVKAAYFLKQAINDYSQAKQINKVKSNLQIIEERIAKLTPILNKKTLP